MVEAAIKAGGNGSHLLPTLLVRRSSIELDASRPDPASTDAARALLLLQQGIEPGTYSSYMGQAYLTLGRALQAQGKNDESRSAARSAVEQLESTLGADHSETRTARQLAGLSTK
jgi:hypothetical protein